MTGVCAEPDSVIWKEREDPKGRYIKIHLLLHYVCGQN